MEAVKYHIYMILRILCTLILEPLAIMQASGTYHLGWKKDFHYEGSNPIFITQEQAKKNPILLLHGDLHNQSAWLSLAKKLQTADVGAVYTLNLPHHLLTNRDFELINAKIETIKSQYAHQGRTDVKINLVGHSRGAKIAYYLGIDPKAWKIKKGKLILTGQPVALREDIGTIIKLGYPTSEWEVQHFGILKNVYDITGNRDMIVKHPSALPQDHQMIVNAGHLGVLYDDQVQEQIIKWLR